MAYLRAYVKPIIAKFYASARDLQVGLYQCKSRSATPGLGIQSADHRAFERALGAKGPPMVKVNPRLARAHAEALGRRAKTGHVDAAMLACPGALLAPLVRPLIGGVPDQMKEPRAARRALGPHGTIEVPFSNFSLLQCASTCGADIRQPITAEVGARDQRSAADAPHTRV